jgi:predicted nicotinamide N-methyase
MEPALHATNAISPCPSDRLLAEFAPPCDVAGCDGVIVHQSEDLFTLWEAWETECGAECEPPFWAIVWPAGLVLSRFILRHKSLILGKTVLEIGCGGGVASIAAARAGASRVIANDIDPIALAIAQRNFTANKVDIEPCRQNVTGSGAGVLADLILVADMFYNRTAAATLIAFLRQARARGANVLIADGGRPFVPTTEISVIAKVIVPVSIEVEGVSQREVKILTLGNV